MSSNGNKYLYSIKEKPNTIPYVTSYYKKKLWRLFTDSDEKEKKLKDTNYQVMYSWVINERNKWYCNFQLSQEGTILISSYLCHPSMANNELKFHH